MWVTLVALFIFVYTDDVIYPWRMILTKIHRSEIASMAHLKRLKIR